MEITETKTEDYPLWLRLLFRLLSAVVAASVLGFAGVIHSDPQVMRNGICFGIFLGLLWGEKAMVGLLYWFPYYL